MKKLAQLGIRFYKRIISPLMPNVCRYTPTCSVYMFQAIDKYGAFVGCFLGFCRLMRCNPFSKGGFNPVRDNLRGKMKWLL